MRYRDDAPFYVMDQLPCSSIISSMCSINWIVSASALYWQFCSFEITPLRWLESSIGGFFSSVGYHKHRHMPITNLYSLRNFYAVENIPERELWISTEMEETTTLRLPRINHEGFLLTSARFRSSFKDQRLLCRADKTAGRHAPTPGIPKRRRKPCALACSLVASRAADKHASMLCQ
jgi:hypothetical protein